MQAVQPDADSSVPASSPDTAANEPTSASSPTVVFTEPGAGVTDNSPVVGPVPFEPPSDDWPPLNLTPLPGPAGPVSSHLNLVPQNSPMLNLGYRVQSRKLSAGIPSTECSLLANPTSMNAIELAAL